MIHKRLFWVFFFAFFIGLSGRLILTFTLPVWQDEAYSIWASQKPLSQILVGLVDSTHPPGYYLLVKLWSLPTNHLIWLRFLTTLLFVVNSFLLYRLGILIKKRTFGVFLTLVYALSGYFVVFDWQVRMYTAVTTFILFSLLLTLKAISRGNFKMFVILTLWNAMGLYFDYGFSWYFAPTLLLFSLKAVFTKRREYLVILISNFLSLALFLLWFPFVFQYFHAGIEGIAWIKYYVSPAFFIPFFLGSHSNTPFSLIFFTFVVGGILTSLKKPRTQLYELVFFPAFASLFCTLILSWFFIPLLHVRSLQIVGLSVVFLLANILTWLYEKHYKAIAYLVLALLALNFVLLIPQFITSPGRFLIRFSTLFT